MFTRIKEDINCILARDPAARSRLEIVTCYPGLHAIWVHRIANRLWTGGWHWLGRFISHLGRMLTGVEIHPGATIGRRVFIDHGHGVVIGETAEVGNDCTIYQGVTLGGTRLYKGEKRHPTLGQGVVVGAGAQVLGGFTVGDGARIGSNAVVVKPVPAGATAVGNPARIILPAEQGQTTQHRPPSTLLTATDTPLGCDPCAEGGLDAKPLQDMLAAQSVRQSASPKSDSDMSSDAFSAYAVNAADTDPLVKVLHELIDHTAKQDARIAQLCRTIESMGKQVNGSDANLDAERLNKLVD
ncbi:MAG: serine O-acetyltransferase [Burkholderiaceae bacterium]|nr:serine O-acetyltransferase [Burkholderiaceae bacterium]MCD8565222.1 serine O-acetyltransferase [Burkholderiaceae bacterium]